MTRYQVFAFELLCCKALFPPAAFNMEEALCSVEEDLQRDLGDRENMSFNEFSNSLFEIVDMWTLTCDKDEYIVFLRNLYLRISEPSVTGSRQWRRCEACLSVETPDLTAILREGEVLKADREMDEAELREMHDQFETSRRTDIEEGIYNEDGTRPGDESTDPLADAGRASVVARRSSVLSMHKKSQRQSVLFTKSSAGPRRAAL